MTLSENGGCVSRKRQLECVWKGFCYYFIIIFAIIERIMKKLLFIIIALLCAVNLSAQSYHFPFKPFKVRVVAQGGNGWVKEGFTDGVVHSFDITIPYDNAFGIGAKYVDFQKSDDFFVGTYGSCSNFISSYHHAFFANLGLGALKYQNDYTVAAYLGFQYDFRLTKFLALGAEVSTLVGILDNDFLTRIDASVGLRFYL